MTASQPARAALFDVDGLLLDSEPCWQQAEAHEFGALGVKLSAADLRSTIGMRIDSVTAHWAARRGWDTRRHPEAVVIERILERVEALVSERGTPLPGVPEALDRCERAGLRLGIASSSPMRIIRVALAALGLEGRFEVVHSADREARGKPDPAVFLGAARRLGVAPGRCVAFEDSLAGLRAAKRAGMTCVVAPDPRLRGDPSLNAADLVVESLADLDEPTWCRLLAQLSAPRPRATAVRP